MGTHEFFFALELSSQGAPGALIEDLALQVFRYVGCPSDCVASLANALERAAAEESRAGLPRCDVQFRAQNGMLEILVSSNGGRLWQHTIVIS